MFVFGQRLSASSDYSDSTTEDVFIPTQCDSIAKPGDHLLLEYTVLFNNGTVASHLKRPSQLYHILLDKSVSDYCLRLCRNDVCLHLNFDV